MGAEAIEQVRRKKKGSVSPIRAAWDFFANVKVALIIMLLVAVAAVPGLLIVQAPDQARVSPEAYAQWLDTIQGKYGGLTNAFNAIGLFDAFNSVWFRAMVALLAASTIICTLNRIPAIWRSVFHPTVKLSDAFYESMTPRSTLIARPGLAGGLRKELEAQRYKVKSVVDGEATYLYGQRNAWVKLGTLATHLAVILFVIGALVSGFFSFRDQNVVIGEGSTYQVGHGTTFGIRLDAFTSELYTDGTPKDYRSEVTVIDQGKEVKQSTITVNGPLSYSGIRVHQDYFGVSPAVQVMTPDNTLIFDNVIPIYDFQGTQQTETGYAQIPDTSYIIQISRPYHTTGADAGKLSATLYRGQTQAYSGNLQLGTPQDAAGLQITFLGDRTYSGFQVVRDPGASIIWGAGGLLVIGLFVSFYLPRRRIWARLSGADAIIIGRADRTVRFGEEIEAMAKRVDKTVPQPAEPAHEETGGEG